MGRVLGLIIALSAGQVLAQAQGIAEDGRIVAETHCTGCHNIEADGPWKEYPPSFASIAQFRDRAQIYARIYYPPFHASMPTFANLLYPNQVNDLVAYIQSLE